MDARTRARTHGDSMFNGLFNLEANKVLGTVPNIFPLSRETDNLPLDAGDRVLRSKSGGGDEKKKQILEILNFGRIFARRNFGLPWFLRKITKDIHRNMYTDKGAVKNSVEGN